MRAAFSDPQGPRHWRALPYLLATLFVGVGMFGPFSTSISWGLALGGVVAATLMGFVPLRQKRRAPAEIACGPGYVDVKTSRTRTQRIHAKSITGASTARTESGILLTLSHDRRDQPIFLEVATEAEAEQVRHALGVGHGGFGTIGWRTIPLGAHKAGAVGRMMALTIGLVIALLAVAFGSEAALVAGILGGQFAFIGLVLALIGAVTPAPAPSIVMNASGLRLQTDAGWFSLPYNLLLDVADRGSRLAFTVPEPYHEVSVQIGKPWHRAWISPDERRALIAQLRAASLRARGMGPTKNDVTGRVDVLRRSGESARDWLVRLDMAGQMLATGSGYRGNTLDMEDLWAILEDPDADAELRAAAARVLKHSPSPEAKVRIDAAVAAVRDDGVNRRLRVAVIDDLDAATHELTTLDAQGVAPQGRSHA